MAGDENFPVYAARIMKLTAAVAAIAASAAFFFWGAAMGAGVIAGALFQLLFMGFLRTKYIRWTKAGRDPAAIGARLVAFTGARLFFEIGACVAAAILIGTGAFGFLAGLLSLTVATVLDKIISVIKE